MHYADVPSYTIKHVSLAAGSHFFQDLPQQKTAWTHTMLHRYVRNSRSSEQATSLAFSVIYTCQNAHLCLAPLSFKFDALLDRSADMTCVPVEQSMVRHKSRLEREKEAAQQQRKAEEAAQAQRAKRKVVHTPGSWAKQVTAPGPLLQSCPLCPACPSTCLCMACQALAFKCQALACN